MAQPLTMEGKMSLFADNYIAQFAMPQTMQSYNLTLIESPSGLKVISCSLMSIHVYF